MFYQALLNAGYKEVDHPSLAEFIVHDAVHPGLEKFLDGHPVFITPHTPQSSFMWDGILPIEPVCCNFVHGEAGVQTLKSYGYPYRAESVGFARCEVKPFRATKGNDLLIVPAHPDRRGRYVYPEYRAWVNEILRRIMRDRHYFGKVTLCWSEDRFEPDMSISLRSYDIQRVMANPWADAEPLKHMIERIEAHDLILSCNTTGCVSVALGKPVVFITESRPRSTPHDALHPELYHHLLRFPLQAENMTTEEILAVRDAPNEKAEYWKQQNIGGNFNADKFISVVQEYIK